MYAVSTSRRIYLPLFLCLCAALLFAPSVANASDYWSVLEKRWIPADQTPNAVKEMLGHKVSRPSGSTLSAVPSAPTISKNATGGLSASTNQILKDADFGRSSPFSATSNYSVSSAKTALKSCVRSAACAGRALGAAGVIYEGIKGWKDVYDFTFGDDGQIYKPSPDIEQFPAAGESAVYVLPYDDSKKTSSFRTGRVNSGGYSLSVAHERPGPGVAEGTAVLVKEFTNNAGNSVYKYTCNIIHSSSGLPLVGYDDLSSNCQYDVSDNSAETNKPKPLVPASPSEIDDSIDDGYEPSVSDAPIVLLSGEPDTISLTTPAPVQLPSTTTTATDSNNQTTTQVTNKSITYNILNNNTSNPSIESSISETTTTYDNAANVIGTSTSTTTNNAVQPDPPSAGASADIELPAFCTWASIVCDWIGWTKEPLDELEPDLTVLISDFEPDQDGFDLGIGSGSCPEPIQLYISFIDKTVEVKYDPFCDFLGMIKPFVLAAAYLFAAYLYLGVLRRG